MFAATAAEEDADAEAFLVGSHGNIFSEKCAGLKGSRWGSFQEMDRGMISGVNGAMRLRGTNWPLNTEEAAGLSGSRPALQEPGLSLLC